MSDITLQVLYLMYVRGIVGYFAVMRYSTYPFLNIHGVIMRVCIIAGMYVYEGIYVDVLKYLHSCPFYESNDFQVPFLFQSIWECAYSHSSVILFLSSNLRFNFYLYISPSPYIFFIKVLSHSHLKHHQSTIPSIIFIESYQ